MDSICYSKTRERTHLCIDTDFIASYKQKTLTWYNLSIYRCLQSFKKLF